MGKVLKTYYTTVLMLLSYDTGAFYLGIKVGHFSNSPFREDKRIGIVGNPSSVLRKSPASWRNRERGESNLSQDDGDRTVGGVGWGKRLLHNKGKQNRAKRIVPRGFISPPSNPVSPVVLRYPKQGRGLGWGKRLLHNENKKNREERIVPRGSISPSSNPVSPVVLRYPKQGQGLGWGKRFFHNKGKKSRGKQIVPRSFISPPSNPVSPAVLSPTEISPLPHTTTVALPSTSIGEESDVKRLLPMDSILPKGLPNLGGTCFANSIIQLLKAIPEFKEAIMNSSSSHPLVLGFQEIFRGLDSPGGIPRNHLAESLGKIFCTLNKTFLASLAFNKQDDAYLFIKYCLELLGGSQHWRAVDAEVVRCLQFKWCSTTQAKDDPGDKRQHYYEPEIMLNLPISETPPGQEIPGEFMAALKSLEGREEYQQNRRNKTVNVIYFKQIVVPPPVLLVKIMRINSSLTNRVAKFDRPMTIPLEFEMPIEMVIDSRPAKYTLIGGVVHSGGIHGGHYIAYIRTSGGFFRFNDSCVQRISDEEALKALRIGAYVLAYHRED